MVLALPALLGREARGAVTWEEIQRYGSRFLEIKEIIDASRVLGKGLGTHIDLAVDQKGALFIADSDNHRLLKYDPTNGQIEALSLPPGRFVAPRAVSFDRKGRLFLANPGLHEILVSENSWFQLAELTGFDSPFEYPVDLEFDSSGTLFVLDSAKRVQCVYNYVTVLVS